MATYRYGTRRVEVRDGEVVQISPRDSAVPSYAKLPKRFRAEVVKRLGAAV